MKPSLYLETTIPSYLVGRTNKDPIIAARQAATHMFYEHEWHKYDLCVSGFVLRECGKGDVHVAKKRLDCLKGITVLEDSPDVDPLAETYIRLLSIPQRSETDAFHLAICCIREINILLSWNFKHLGIRKMQIIQRYNDVHSLSTPQMITPYHLMY